MGTRPYETTNERIETVLEGVDQLIDWAAADAEHATDNDAKETARDDRRRERKLRKARDIIADCFR